MDSHHLDCVLQMTNRLGNGVFNRFAMLCISTNVQSIIWMPPLIKHIQNWFTPLLLMGTVGTGKNCNRIAADLQN